MGKHPNYKIWLDGTRGAREHNSAEFMPAKRRIPSTAPAGRLKAAVEDLTVELKPKKTDPAPLGSGCGTPQSKTIRKQKELFQPIIQPLADFAGRDGQSPRAEQPEAGASPRVGKAKPIGINEARGSKFGPGTAACKEFIGPATSKKLICTGTALFYKSPWHRMMCEDGDEEDLAPGQATKIAQKKKANQGILHNGTKGHARAASSIIHQYGDKLLEDNPFNDALLEHAIKSNTATHHKTGEQLEHRQLIEDPECKEVWLLPFADEIGNLLQGTGGNEDGTQRVKGTGTCFWIPKGKMPPGRVATHARIVCGHRMQKVDRSGRMRITACGNFITGCPNEVSTETAGPETIKLHWNSVPSTPGAKHMTIGISTMHLSTELGRHECMKFHLRDLPQEVMDECGLLAKAGKNDWCCCEIRKAICGSKQSGFLAHKQLEKMLKTKGCYPPELTSGLWLHKTRNISFTLVVDDFGVPCTSNEDAWHLVNLLEKQYPIKLDWKGGKCIGIDLEWGCGKRELATEMKGCALKALHQFMHGNPAKPCHSPSKHVPPKHGEKAQRCKMDASAPMTETKKLYLQQICGKFLCCARAAGGTILHALNDLASRQSNGTQETIKAMLHFLNLAATHPNAKKVCRASGMILPMGSDAAHLVVSEARSKAGGFQHLGSKDGNLMNGSIAVAAKTTKNVMASAAEAEVGALHMNAQAAAPLRVALEELGFPQPPTPMKVDDTTANGIINGNLKQLSSTV